MAFFVAVIAPNFFRVTWSAQTILILVVSLISLTRLDCVDSGGRDKAFLLPLLLVVSAAVFFFSPAKLLQKPTSY